MFIKLSCVGRGLAYALAQSIPFFFVFFFVLLYSIPKDSGFSLTSCCRYNEALRTSLLDITCMPSCVLHYDVSIV